MSQATSGGASIPIFRISMSNATVLSVAYLLVATGIEASRRWYSFRWWWWWSRRWWWRSSWS